jgi:hypothetical protein
MQYMLMFFESEQELAKREDPQRADAYWGAWRAYVGVLSQSGVIVNGDGLYPPRTATRVSVRAEKRYVQDGPVPDVKEHLGGYFIVEVKDLDAALDLAAKAPNVGDGYTEVRPVLPPPGS